MSTTFTPDRSAFEEAMGAMIVQSSPYCSQYLFYANMITQCAIHFKSMKAPASVRFNLDHYVLSIDSDKFNAFPLEHRLGVLKHEMLHILGGHLIRFEDRENFQKWNFATDCAINQLIETSHLPSGCINPSNLPVKPSTKVPVKVNSEQYYDLIDDDQLPPEDGSGDGSGPQTLDDHSDWKNSQGTNETLQKDITKSMMEKAANETQKSRGNIPGEFSDWLDINSSKSQVDWKRVLRNQLSNKKANIRRTLMRSDRRFYNREDLKGKTKDRVATPVIVGDESGSVSDIELQHALSECLNLCKTLSLPVWYIPVDTKVHKPSIIKSSQRTFNRQACGGTVLAPAVQAIKDKKLEATSIIVLTDGGICESDVTAFKNTNKPVIWLITEHGSILDSMNDGKMQAFKLDNK